MALMFYFKRICMHIENTTTIITIHFFTFVLEASGASKGRVTARRRPSGGPEGGQVGHRM